MTQGGDFGLRRFLAADLRRARALQGRSVEVGGLRLAVGLLSPRFAPVLLCRLAHWFHRKRLGPFSKVTSLINFTVFGIEIAARCHIGKGLFFPHTQGTVIGAHSIGENATIYHNVTLGARDLDLAYSDDKRPIVEDDVLIASGAKIIGGIRIGSGARIGANALVLKSVPAGAVARAPLAEILPPAAS